MMFSLIKLYFILGKELISMNFTKDSQIVKSYVLLILADKMTYEEVPNLFNLREAVAEVLTS